MVTSKEMKDDIDKISLSLSDSAFEIPPFWRCIWPGLIACVSLVIWQFVVAYKDMTWGYSSIRNNGYFSMLFTLLIGFAIFLMIMSSLGKYLSVPKKIRETSLIFSLIRSKLKTYALAWVGLNIFIGMACLILPVGGSIISSAGQFITLCLVTLVFNADISRFELSSLNSVVSIWRQRWIQKVDKKPN